MKHLLTVLFFISPFVLSAQSVKKGFVVLSTGDTLYGYINYKPGQKIPGQIRFRKDSLDKNIHTYTTADLKYIEIPGYDIYISAVVGKSVPISMVLPTSNTSGDTVIKQAVFLRVLLKGDKLNLYETNNEIETYYIQEGEGEYQELLLQKRIDDGYERELPVYRNQLMVLAARYGMNKELEREITDLRYDEDALKKVIRRLNGTNSVIHYTSGKQKAKLSCVINGGIAISTLKLSGDKGYIGDLKFNNYTSPYFSAGAELSNISGDRLSVRFEVSYYMAKYSGKGPSVTSSLNEMSYELEQRNIVPSLAVHYAFIKQRLWGMFAGLGAGYHISSYSKNTWSQTFPPLTQDNYANLKKNWVAMNARLGITIMNRVEIGASLRFLDDFIQKSVNYSFNTRTYTFSVGYKFEK